MKGYMDKFLKTAATIALISLMGFSMNCASLSISIDTDSDNQTRNEHSEKKGRKESDSKRSGSKEEHSECLKKCKGLTGQERAQCNNRCNH